MSMRTCCVTPVLLALIACGPQQGGSAGETSETSDTSDTSETGGPGSSSAPTGGDTSTSGEAPTSGAHTSTGDVPSCPSAQPGELRFEVSLAEPAGMVWAQAIALDADGVSYLVGALWDDDVDSRPALVRIEQDGNFLDMHVHESIGAKGFVVGVARMTNGRVLVGGRRGEPLLDAFVADFSAEGSALGLSPLPGPGDRHIDALAIGPLDELVVAGQDAAQVFWTTAVSPGGDVMWDVMTAPGLGGPTRLAVGPGGEVATTHGRWDAQQGLFAELAFNDAADTTSWAALDGGVDDIGQFTALTVRADDLVIAASTRLMPPGRVELRAVDIGGESWRTTLLDEADARLFAHDAWQTAEGHTQVLVTRHAPAVDPVEVDARVLSVDADGQLLGALPLAFDLDVARDTAPAMRAVPDECGTLRIWDSPSRILRSVQL